MKILSIINLKGGVAKTISSTNIAYILSAVHGYKVLLVDNDKQGNASNQFNRHSYSCRGTETLMTEKGLDIHTIIQKTNYENLDIITANMKLLSANLQVLLDQTRPQQIRFKNAFQSISQEYDYIIIDNAPDINVSTINALVASHYVIVPIKIDKNAMDGMEELVEQIENTREEMNHDLQFLGWFTTQFVKNPVNIQGEELLKTQYEYPYFNTHIRRTEKIDESTYSGLPITLHSARCGAAKDYLDFVDEFLQKTAEK